MWTQIFAKWINKLSYTLLGTVGEIWKKSSIITLIFPLRNIHRMHVCMLSCFSHVWLFATLWTMGRQAPLSMGFSRQEYWSGLPFPPPGESSWPRDRTWVSHFAEGFFTVWATRQPYMDRQTDRQTDRYHKPKDLFVEKFCFTLRAYSSVVFHHMLLIFNKRLCSLLSLEERETWTLSFSK